MKSKKSLNCGNIIMEEDILYRNEPADALDVIEQAYYAESLTKYGNVAIFGTGAERGTFGQFANVEIIGLPFHVAITSLRWFTNIFNKALKNQGVTTKKNHFYLTQMEEIIPFLKWFGLEERFNLEWDKVKTYDERHDLASVLRENGKIEDWQDNTMRVDIPLVDNEMEIMEDVTTRIAKAHNGLLTQYTNNPLELIQTTFIEGMGGLVIGNSTDFDMLIEGGSFNQRYQIAS